MSEQAGDGFVKCFDDQQEVVEAALAADREAALRDVFAASALGALIVQEGRNYRLDPHTVALKSYVYADAMLAARKR